MVFMQLFNFTNLHHYHPIVLLLLHKHMPGTTFYRILGANFEYLIQSIVMPQVCLELRFRHLNSFLNNKKLVFVNFHMKIRAFVYSRCKKCILLRCTYILCILIVYAWDFPVLLALFLAIFGRVQKWKPPQGWSAWLLSMSTVFKAE